MYIYNYIYLYSAQHGSLNTPGVLVIGEYLSDQMYLNVFGGVPAQQPTFKLDC